MALDDLTRITMEFLINARPGTQNELSEIISGRFRSSVLWNRIQSGHRIDSDSESDETEWSEEQERRFQDRDRLAPRRLPQRKWIYDQTESLVEEAGWFGKLLSFFFAERNRYPVMKILSDVVPLNIQNRAFRNYEELLRASGTLEAEGYSIKLAPPEEAAEYFSLGYTLFVKSVEVAVPQMPPSYPSHLHFTLASKSRGYRVHSTPLYWMNPEVFGESKSTPVRGYLPPGVYRFGGDNQHKTGQTNAGIVWDAGQHRVSPTNSKSIVTAF
jgi:hypothetical protein